MNSNLPTESSGNEGARWPTASILAYGTFGARSAAGRRYHARCGIALAAVVVCIFGGAALRTSVPKSILTAIVACAPGVAFIYIAWEFRRYLAALDELARRMQLESIALTYLCGMAAAMLLGGIGLIYNWGFNPGWFILLEPVRAVWLYFVARRYQ
jgi:hypothetical protein